MSKKNKQVRTFVPCTGGLSEIGGGHDCPSALSEPGIGLHCACVGDGKPCCYCGFRLDGKGSPPIRSSLTSGLTWTEVKQLVKSGRMPLTQELLFDTIDQIKMKDTELEGLKEMADCMATAFECIKEHAEAGEKPCKDCEGMARIVQDWVERLDKCRSVKAHR